MKISIQKYDWDQSLIRLLSSYDLFAPLKERSFHDYARIDSENVAEIIYNQAKPVSPLKTFFLPVKENLTSPDLSRPKIILGPPSCDITALSLLDAIYLDEDYPDPAYRYRRQQTTLISMDCHSSLEHCHCEVYKIEPGKNAAADISVALDKEEILIRTHSTKGEELLQIMGLSQAPPPEEELLKRVEARLEHIRQEIKERNKSLPDYERSAHLIKEAPEEIWKQYASTCVSCGACSAICPSCSCFLLIDRPGFEKVRQLDTCQHPGFERVAGGEDPLQELSERFRNRYLCKYVWKPEKYKLKACTGCGRCTEACIGDINKNELLSALSN